MNTVDSEKGRTRVAHKGREVEAVFSCTLYVARSTADKSSARAQYDNLPENSQHFFKKSKDKAVPGKRGFER